LSKQIHEIIEIHRKGHRKYKHILTIFGIFFFIILLSAFFVLAVKGAVVQAFIIVFAFWFWRRIYIPILIPKFESDADIYAAKVLNNPKLYREKLRQLMNLQETIPWRYRYCLKDHINERCVLLKDTFKERRASDNLRIFVRRLTVGTWLGSFILLSIILSMKSDYVKSIGASRYDELSVKYYIEGDFDKAVAYGKIAVEKTPDNFNYLYNLAIAYIQKEEKEKAINLLEKVVAINPYYPEGHYNLGMLYGNKGLMDKEIEEYNKVISIDHDLPDAHYHLGLAYLKKGLNDKAAASLKKCIPLYPAEDPCRIRAIEIINGLNKQSSSSTIPLVNEGSK
jgi:tetratricopeptide (TPR) repeat protein